VQQIKMAMCVAATGCISAFLLLNYNTTALGPTRRSSPFYQLHQMRACHTCGSALLQLLYLSCQVLLTETFQMHHTSGI
jgi:hypothetical protein